MLKNYLPSHAPIPSNPVDFAGALRTPLDEARVVEAIARIDYIDGIITNIPIYGFSSHSPGEMARMAIEGAEILIDIPRRYKKPIVAIRWGPRIADFVQEMIKKGGIPVYDTPEECARAMYALYYYSKIKNKTHPH
jgi:acyl-CoA synthetase (NDP forming)